MDNKRAMYAGGDANPNPFREEAVQKAQFDARAFNPESLRYLANVLQAARGATAFLDTGNRPFDIWETLSEPSVRRLIDRAVDEAMENPWVMEDLSEQKYTYLTQIGSPFHPSEMRGRYEAALQKRGEDKNYWEALARIVSSVGRTISNPNKAL